MVVPGAPLITAGVSGEGSKVLAAGGVDSSSANLMLSSPLSISSPSSWRTCLRAGLSLSS